MKKLHLILLFTLVAFAASAQKVYFVYIQAESEQPFFVKLSTKILHSSGSGYLIIPKLVDSTYTFSIGSSQNKFPEQLFKVSIDKQDKGFLLKNFDGKGWGLYNLQTQDVLMAMNSNENPGSGNTSASPFTEILAKATNDPSLKDKPVQPKKEEVKMEVVQETKKEETPISEKIVNPAPVVSVSEDEGQSKKEKRKKQKEAEKAEAELLEKTESKKTEPNKTNTKEESKPEEIKETVIPVEEKKNTAAEVNEEVKPESRDEKKVSSPEVKTEEKPAAKDAVVVTEEKKEIQPQAKAENMPAVTNVIEEKKATPENKEVKTNEKYKPSEVKKYAESSTTEGFGLVFIDKYDNAKGDTIRLVIPNPKPAVVKIVEAPKEEKKFIEISAEPEKEAKQPANTVTYKTDCPDLATDEEFVKLRKKMAGEKEDRMLGEAKKYFKTKCFSTNQVRTLGRLFETDEERYNFFDTAYKHVSNPEAFPALVSEFQDSYYSNRFKAMLR